MHVYVTLMSAQMPAFNSKRLYPKFEGVNYAYITSYFCAISVALMS